MDTRHTKRTKIVQNLYAKLFQKEANVPLPNQSETAVVNHILENLQLIDSTIATHAPKYPLEKIAKIDLCILRLAIFELMIEKKEPTKVIINEAVELGKEYGNDRSYAFINAVLGAVVNINKK